MSTPLGFHFADTRGPITPGVQVQFHGPDFLEDGSEILQAGNGRTSSMIEQGDVFARAAKQQRPSDDVERDSGLEL